MYVPLFKGKIKIPIILVILHSLSHPVSTLLCFVSSRFPCPLASGWLGRSLGWSEGGGKSDKYLFSHPLPALVLCSGNGPVSLGYSYHQAAPLPAALAPIYSPGDCPLLLEPTVVSSWISHQLLLVPWILLIKLFSGQPFYTCQLFPGWHPDWYTHQPLMLTKIFLL